MSKILGIDLGTTNSCMAVMEGGESTVIPNREGGRTTPSIVAFTKSGERLVGQAAKRQAITNPGNTIFSAKRLIGRKYSEVEKLAKQLPYKVVEGPNGAAMIECQVGDKTERFSPEQISAMVLQHLKADAEAYLGEPITEAVITVPAYFNDAQRQATKDAGTIAGLNVRRIINEPTAASLAYGLDKKNDETIAVYDLGGGTYDISILEIGDGVFEVKATNGDTELGGDNFDSPMALQRLKEESEKAKIALSSAQETDINLPFITADATGPKHLNVKLTRAKLEQLTDSLIEKTVKPFEACLKDANLSKSDIDELVLVGGMTRMPKVVETANKLAGKEAHKGVNPDEVVARGAAIQGGVLQGDVRDVLLLDVTPLTLSIETAGGVATPMIERNTTIPKKASQIFSTYADNQTAVDIRVLQGERPMAKDNKLIGNFRLDGINPAPRGLPQIEVTFDIDANGILNVSAKDKSTGKEQKITITNSSGLSKEEVERLRKEAELHAAEDANIKETAEARNELDNMAYGIEKQIKENGSKLPAQIKGELEEGVKKAQELLKDNSATKEALKSETQKLTNLLEQSAKYFQEAAQSSASAGAQQAQTGAGQSSEAPKNDAVDADFEVVDDDDSKKSS